MTDDEFLQEVDTYDGRYFPQMPPEKEQAQRLEKEGFLTSFVEEFPNGPPERLYRLTPRGKQRIPRYRSSGT